MITRVGCTFVWLCPPPTDVTESLQEIAARAEALARERGDCALTVAGGVRSAGDIARLDALGIDVQVGMALYTGAISLAEGFLAPVRARCGDGPWPTVVCDDSGRALGLVYSDHESVAAALETGRGVYHSRRRGLWVKGETSGQTQELLGIDLDCDRDALRFTVRQRGAGFCHTGAHGCFGAARGVPALAARLAARQRAAPAGSYTRRLLDDPYRTFLLPGSAYEQPNHIRVGVGGGSEHTLEEVGQNFTVTRERIRQIEAKALRKLKHPSRSRKLRSFLDQ